MRYKILLVDDSQDLLDAYVVFLKIRTSHEVRTAASGRSALEIIRTWRPDLVVTDILMPDMSGLELISHIRSDLPPPLPIIAAWSGFPEYETEARRRGAQVFQPKPLHPNNLVLFIESLLGEREPPEHLRADAQARRHAASQLAQAQLLDTLRRRPYVQKVAELSTRLVSRYFEDADVGLLVMDSGRMRVFAACSASGTAVLENAVAYAVNIVESGSTLILPDLAAIPAGERRTPAPDTRLFVAVPVRVEGVTIGALALADGLRPPFDAHDLALLEHIGDRFAGILADEPSSRVPHEPGVLLNESWRYCLRHEIEHLRSRRRLVVALAPLPPKSQMISVSSPEQMEYVRLVFNHLIELLPPRAVLGRLDATTLAAYALVEDPDAGEPALRELLASLADEPEQVRVAALTVSALRPADGGAAIIEVAHWLLAAAAAYDPGTTLHARLSPEIAATRRPPDNIADSGLPSPGR